MIDLSSLNCDFCQDSGYEPLKQFIIQATGLVYYTDKDDDFSYRIAKRMAETQQPDCSGYLALLQESDSADSELDRIVEALTVGETSFFRHAELFDALKQVVIPDLLKRNCNIRRLRIWSAGCSIGAEPYSLAILLAREYSHALEDWDVSILGTDINRKFLAQANRGIYRSWDFRGMDREEIEDCFVQHGPDWQVKPEYRRWVSFQHHNLARHPFPLTLQGSGMFDLVLCRNVLMYFGLDIMRRLVGQFHESLATGGWLLVGHAEPSIEIFRSFRTVNFPGAVLYQKDGLTHESPWAASTSESTQALKNTAIPECVKPPSIAVLVPPRPNPTSVVPESELVTKDAVSVISILEMADKGELDLALRECQRQLQVDPMNSMLHLQHAILSEQSGHMEQVEPSLRRCIYLDPRQALALYFTGLLEQKRGRRREALQAYEQVQDLLAESRDDEAIAGADGLTVSDLRDLIRLQQEGLRAS